MISFPALHLLYIANTNFNPAFASMRILSLGAFIAMRLEVRAPNTRAAVIPTMRFLLFGQNGSIFIGNLGLFWIRSDR